MACGILVPPPSMERPSYPLPIITGILNQWTTKEVPELFFFLIKDLFLIISLNFICSMMILRPELVELTLKKENFFIIGDWNAKVGSQEIPGITAKFSLGVQNKAGKRLTEF